MEAIYSVAVVFLVTILHSVLSAPLDCAVSPCANGGTCVQTNDGAMCQCAPGYTGTTCGDTVCPTEFKKYTAKVFPDVGVCIGYIQPWCNGSAASGVCREAGGELAVLSDSAKYTAFKEYGKEYHGTGFWVNAAKMRETGNGIGQTGRR